jgi:hypothetical protein
METKITPVWTKILILSLIMIVFGLVLFFADLWKDKTMGWIQYVILFIGVIFFCIQYAKQMNADVTFGNVFGHGFKIVAGTTAIQAVWALISIYFIFPEMTTYFMEEAEKGMRQNSAEMTDQQISSYLATMKKFLPVIVILSLLFFNAVVGLIASLIGAAAAKKHPNPNPL